MRISEPFLPFTRNLLCKRIRFDDKLDLIDKIIPIDDKTCLLVDRARNFHLKVYSPEDEDAASLQFPLPPYAHNSNPNVHYSVDYMDLYHYINKKQILEEDVEDYIYSLDRERMKYIQFVYLGDSKLAVQLNSGSPVTILDLHEPKNPPVILQDVYGVKNLVSVGNGCLAWYEKSASLVILYHSITQKRKVLNFRERSIKELYSLKDHAIIAVSLRQIEILDYAKNKVIKSIGFINDALIPDVVVHSEANIISYLEGFCIHILKIEKGRIKWENYYEFKEYDEFATYRFIAHNLIALKTGHKIHILYIDSKSVALHTVIEHPLIGFLNEPGLEYLCCESACKEGVVWGIHPLGNNRFGVVECVCREKFYSHGQQRVSVFKLENLQIQADNATSPLFNVDSIKFKISKSIIFEEFRDEVKALDVFDDDTFGMFITEKGRLFRVDLKDYSIKHIIELKGLVKRDGLEIKKIDKILVMAEDRVIITIKTDSSPYARIVILALDSLQVDFDSDILKEETEKDGEYSFYDVVKMRPNRTLVSFKMKRHGVTSYNLGGFYDDYEGEYDGYSFGEYSLSKRDEIIYDRLWRLEGFLIAMRHGENVFHLSFLDLTSPKTVKFLTKKRFKAEKFVSVSNPRMWGILDVRSVDKDIACIQIKLNSDETELLVYNIQTEKLLNKIKTKAGVIGPIRHCYKENDMWRNLQEMMIFGDYKTVSSGIALKPVKDVIDKTLDHMESSAGIYGFCITARNFKALKTQDRALIYESDHHKNFICVLKSPKFKLECLKIMKEAIGNIYHEYIYKSVFETIFGVNL